jgi:hypothetical protein
MPPEITVWEPRWWLQDIPSKAFHTRNRGSRHVPIISKRTTTWDSPWRGRKILKENPEALQKEMNSHESNCLVPLPLFRPRAFRQRFVIPSVARNLLLAGAGGQQVACRFDLL